jgi:pimeloyl-ACP methyl ester carboxylesterase
MPHFASDAAPTSFVDGPSNRFAYRRIGQSDGTPLVLAQRFRGTIDHWDPLFLDALAAERDLIVFDNAGINLSSGTPARTVAGMAQGLAELVESLGLPQVDVLGWSMGGFVSQRVALDRPDLVRRLIVASSSPGAVPGTPAPPAIVGQVAGKPVNDDADFLYMFFPETTAAREAGLASLRRLDTRLAASNASVALEAVGAQQASFGSWSREEGLWERLGELSLPVLVGSGGQDLLIHAFNAYSMAQRLPDAKIVIYSDAGHAFLFQHPADFAREILEFLR